MDSPGATRIEPRWPPALVIAVASIVIDNLPGRLRPEPLWLAYLVVAGMFAAMASVSFGRHRARWLRVEAILMFCFLVILGLNMLRTLGVLVGTILYHPNDIPAIPLLSSSVAVWLTNVVLFSLVYWRVDRGGPEARANFPGAEPDWLFPRMERVQGYRPSFIDYLFLSFSTSTAFSAADAVPLTDRAKILMMTETSVGLVIVVVVAARAISVLS